MHDIIIYGQDPRMESAARSFYHLGYEVFENPDQNIEHSCVVVSPKLSAEEERKLCSFLFAGQTLYYGILSPESLRQINEKGIFAISYLHLYDVVTENAKLTAKGILEIAKKDVVLKESHCLVLGYGHCGKAIAHALSLAGAHVDVAVRRKELSAEIEGAHFGYVNIRQRERQTFDTYSCVFNTVPALILDAKWLQCFSLSVRIYDIATSPGGTDFSYCKEHAISAGLFPGIPGKMYPEEAGRIIVSGIVEQETAINPPSE